VRFEILSLLDAVIIKRASCRYQGAAHRTAEPGKEAKPTTTITPSGIPTVEPPSLSEHMGRDVVPW
jgi:hypothetical protein